MAKDEKDVSVVRVRVVGSRDIAFNRSDAAGVGGPSGVIVPSHMVRDDGPSVADEVVL